MDTHFKKLLQEHLLEFHHLDQASAMEVVFDSMQIALSVKRSDNQIIESSYFDGLNDNWNNEKYDNDVDFDLS